MKPRRSFHEIFSSVAAKFGSPEPDIAWSESLRPSVRCSSCWLASDAWNQDPQPIGALVRTMPAQGLSLGFIDVFPNLIHNELLLILKPFMTGFVFGECVYRVDGADKVIPYATFWVPAKKQLEAARGKWCQHKQCAACKRIYNMIYSVPGGILERDLDDRLIYQDHNGNVLIDRALLDKFDLLRRFKDLRLYRRCAILRKPLDGDVLPGDPEWDGVFRTRSNY